MSCGKSPPLVEAPVLDLGFISPRENRNRAHYGRPGYLEYYRRQLRQLRTNHGPIFEMWFNGANGGEGYDGGAKETRKIDNTTYFDWPETKRMVRGLQASAVIFSDGGPDVRWVAWRELREATFSRDLAKGSTVTASETHGNDSQLAAGNLADGRKEPYRSIDDSVTRAEVILDLKAPSTFNPVRLREFLPLGQRIDAVGLDYYDASTQRWTEFATATSIGAQRLVSSQNITTTRVRARVTRAGAGPPLRSRSSAGHTAVKKSNPI